MIYFLHFGILDALEKAGAHKEYIISSIMSCGCSASFPGDDKIDGLPPATIMRAWEIGVHIGPNIFVAEGVFDFEYLRIVLS